MARPIAFDEAVALDAAIECFWHHGYRASSVRDLASSMGICGTSLYNSFGNKRSLFIKALERYLDRSVRARIRRLQSLPPKRAIYGFFDEIIERSLQDRARRGCLLINSALEVAPHDRKLGVEIAQRLDGDRGFLPQSDCGGARRREHPRAGRCRQCRPPAAGRPARHSRAGALAAGANFAGRNGEARARIAGLNAWDER